MNNSLSFFRAFDLAFFAPGMLLFGTLWYTGCFPIDDLSSKDDTVHGIILGAFAVSFIFILGLICHGIHRVVLRLIRLIFKKQQSPTGWYVGLKKDNPSYELIMYFWYLRSTCWNLVVAIMLTIITFDCRHDVELSRFEALIFLIVIGLLVFLGIEFDKSMRKAVESSE